MAEELRNEGNALFKTGDYLGAAAKYTAALAQDPANTALYGNRAAAYMALNRFEDAYTDGSEALNRDPENQKYIARLAKLTGLLGNPTAALQLYSKLSSPASSNDLFPFLEMERNYKQAQNLEGKAAGYALDAAERYLGKGVNIPASWSLLRAKILASTGKTAEAESLVVNLLRREKTPEALLLRARLILQNGNEIESAIAHFRQALQLDPDNSEARVLYKQIRAMDQAKTSGNTAYTARNYSSAISFYTEAIECINGIVSQSIAVSKLYSNRASAHSVLGNHAESIEDAELSLEIDSTFDKPMRLKARSLSKLEKYDESLQAYQAYMQAHPEDTQIRVEVRTVEFEIKKGKRKDLYKILEIEKTASSYEIKRAYRKLALVYHPDKNQGNEEAEEKFKQITEAYETLSDDQKRQRYDSGADIQEEMPFGGGFGGGFGQGFGSPYGAGGGVDPSVLFQMFGNSGFSSGF
ncbi:hypothetical protein DASB73_003690 [Starmerella bacillaris]|uniref:J domain-containing protein n=1 Tax=Starmerella bacillaris TaxID=1247836 RepID=A0AAV5RCW3_STABA|nr:hypothetical protein DASB73_003690 [Starmerella bacillaris]